MNHSLFILNIVDSQGFWRRQWHPTPALLPGKSYGQRILVGYSQWGRWESDTAEWLHFDFSLSCIGEGNGDPLQCSCLENPRDGRAWWAAVYGVAQSRTQLKRLSSSSSSSIPAFYEHMYWSWFQCCIYLYWFSQLRAISDFEECQIVNLVQEYQRSAEP